jgi:CO/xanthine dehydrogenase FAD-binding subunit
MKSFDYAAPSSLDQAIRLLSLNKGRTKVLAGGTDLLIGMMMGKISTNLLVSLKNIPDLRGIQKAKGGVRIGACCTFQEIENSPLINQKYGILSQACGSVGSLQIRCRATIGGNLCNASPAADTAAPLMALGAQVIMQGPSGERKVGMEHFFTGPGQTILNEDEILTAIRLPDGEEDSTGLYMKLGRRKAMEIAIVGVAIYAIFTRSNGTIKDIKIGLSSIAPTPIRAWHAESLLKGLKPSKELIEKVSEMAREATNPISDIRGSREYRKKMVKVLTRRVLTEVLSNDH